MTLRAVWVGYGRPSLIALREEIAAVKSGDPLAPVTVIVASNHVGVATRRLLASGDAGPIGSSGRGLIAVDFVTAYRLAELYGSASLAEAGRLPVSTPVLTAAVRGALGEAPGVFASVATHPATEEALVAAYRELRDLSEGSLDLLAAAGRRTASVVQTCRAVRHRLQVDWYDEEDLTEAAARVVEAGGSLGRVVVYLPQRLSRHMAALIVATGVAHEVTVLAGTTGNERADAEVLSSLERLGLVATRSQPEVPYSAGRTSIVSTSDADEEVRQAVRVVVEAVRSGARADRIAVLHASPEPYSRLVHEHFRAAAIPTNGAAVIPLRERVAPRALLHLLELSASNFGRPEVLAWLSGSPVLFMGEPVPISTWEKLSRRAGVVAGREQWDGRLESLAADSEASLSEDGSEVSRHVERAAQVRHLREFVLQLIDRLKVASDTPVAWSERVSWAKETLVLLLGTEDSVASDWPPEEVTAYRRVNRALNRLRSLDRFEAPVDLATFTKTLEIELDSDLGRVGRLGEGVLVGPIGLGTGLDLDHLVVLGLAEGTFPAPVRDDSLLSDRDRSRIPHRDLPLRRESVDRQHRQLLAAAAGARSQTLCMPRGDLRGSSQRLPSRWLLDAANAINATMVGSADLLVGNSAEVTTVASYAAGMGQNSFPTTAQERRLKELLADPAWDGDPVYRSGQQMVQARRGRSFTRYDGNLSGVALVSPVDSVVSATRLEAWVACPHAYFMRYLLGVRELDEPGDEVRITPLDRGSLIHDALDRFINEALPARRVWDDSDRLRMAKIVEEVCDSFEERGLTGRPLYWSSDRRQILAELDRFVTEDIGQGTGATSWPIAAELGFENVSLALADGRFLRFNGRVDRVDIDHEGRLTVIDYKTGRAEPYRRLDPSDPGGGGAHLQLAIYALAAQAHGAQTGAGGGPVTSHYWMVSSRGGWGRYGYEVDGPVLDKVGSTVARIVEGLEAGVFPNHPTRSSTSPFSNCPYCDLDGLGEVDLRRAWERKRDDPAMAVYRDLVEPAGE